MTKLDTGAQQALHQQTTQPDWQRLATRSALVKVFGPYGLKEVWFKDLGSRKWLQAARKVEGRGQKGRAVEPMFCPYQVMTGLVKRSYGSNLQPETGWRLLERHFPKVYQAHSAADPREPTG